MGVRQRPAVLDGFDDLDRLPAAAVLRDAQLALVVRPPPFAQFVGLDVGHVGVGQFLEGAVGEGGRRAAVAGRGAGARLAGGRPAGDAVAAHNGEVSVLVCLGGVGGGGKAGAGEKTTSPTGVADAAAHALGRPPRQTRPPPAGLKTCHWRN